MKTFIYFYLPIKEEILLEYSLNETLVKGLFKDIYELKKIINTSSIQIQMLHDSENIIDFIQKINDLSDYSDFPIKKLFRNYFHKSAINFRDNPVQKGEASYYLWSLTDTTVIPLNGHLFAESIEQWNDKDKFLIIDFGDDYSDYNRKFFTFFKDTFQFINFPKFFHVDYVIGLEEFNIWLATNHESTFSLLDRARFDKTKFYCQGAMIYKEKATKRYWYLDNLHKDHYEVFDKTGKDHIGIANLKGVIDESKSENDRTIDVN